MYFKLQIRKQGGFFVKYFFLVGGGGGAITRSHHDWVFAMSMILKIGLD